MGVGMRVTLLATVPVVLAEIEPLSRANRELEAELYRALAVLLLAELQVRENLKVREENPLLVHTPEQPDIGIEMSFYRADNILVSIYRKLQEEGFTPEWPRKPEYGWSPSWITPEEARAIVTKVDSWFDSLFS